MLKLLEDDKITYDLAYKKLSLAYENYLFNNGIIISTIPTFKEHISELANQSINGYKGLLSNSKDLIVNLFRSNDVKNIDKINFIALSLVIVNVPEGFYGNLSIYSKVMVELYKRMVTSAFEYASKLNIALGLLVNDKAEKLSVKSYEGLYSSYAKLREDAVKTTNAFFENNSSNTKSTLGDLFTNKDEIRSTFINIEELEKLIKGTNINQITSSINETSELLDELSNQIKLDSQLKFSPQVVQLLAEGVHESALYYEYLSTLFYDCDVLINIVTQINNAIKKNI